MDQQQQSLERRALLRGLGVAGAAVAGGAVLVACGGNDSTATGGGSSPTPDTSSPGGGGGNSSASALVATADVPEGGGIVLSDPEVVVTQPKAGEFVAFSSICTHQGCPVNEVANGTINCPCHGSRFSIEDGSVVAGPAPAPLPPVQVTVDGGEVVRA
jgi:Rieske Fe-S protein